MSFSIHAGGLPLSFYLLPMRLDRRIYVATAGLFICYRPIQNFPLCLFGSNELSKYLYVFDAFASSPLGVYAGAYLVDKINQDWFYRIGYFCTPIAGFKLVYDRLQSYM